MSDEHVIPESLGGYYHIYTVCKQCNSTMGSKVDSPLINHKLSELYRFSEEIKGKKGSVPNPFSGVFFYDENKSDNAKVSITAEKKLDISFLPRIKPVEENGSVISVEIGVDSRNEDQIDEILNKFLERNKIPRSAISKGVEK